MDTPNKLSEQVIKLLDHYKEVSSSPTPSGFIDFLSSGELVTLGFCYLEEFRKEVCDYINI